MQQKNREPWWVASPLSKSGVGIQIQNALRRLCGKAMKGSARLSGWVQPEVTGISRSELGALTLPSGPFGLPQAGQDAACSCGTE